MKKESRVEKSEVERSREEEDKKRKGVNVPVSMYG